MAAETIDEYVRLLRKRGFKQDDAYVHECGVCGARAALRLGLQGRRGGRDFELCGACGATRSWTRAEGAEERIEDADFDIDAFLR